jgi:hypothetical protein
MKEEEVLDPECTHRTRIMLKKCGNFRRIDDPFIVLLTPLMFSGTLPSLSPHNTYSSLPSQIGFIFLIPTTNREFLGKADSDE